jgi:hypothetical protein
MRNLHMPVLLVIFFAILGQLAGACTSPLKSFTQESVWRDISRRDLDLLDCGIDGSLPTRLNDCAIRNPAYAVSQTPKGPKWHLVTVDRQLRLEFWANHETGAVWSNILPFKRQICEPLGSILNGDHEMRFMLATTVDYQKAFENPVPFPVRSDRARYFVLGDSEDSGVAADETRNRFMNVDSEEMLWARCVAKSRIEKKKQKSR